MKKILATLTALVMVFALGAAALAEAPAAPALAGGVQFNMDMEQVMELVNLPNPEIDREKTRGKTEFYELEYENYTDPQGVTADLKYLFVGNSLVAVHYDMAKGTSYESVKAQLTAAFGEAVPFDAAKIGNGIYAIDDDGDVKDCREMIEAQGLTIVLEQDDDGDVDVTWLDPAAAYINN